MDERLVEKTIVDQFGNLQVITSCSFVNMDKLVQDLSSALDESSKARSSEMILDQVLRRQTRKRRVLKRRASNPGTSSISNSNDYGNKSEASQSSFDETVKDFFENVALLSDSDDIIVTKRLSTCSLPVLNNLSLHESDSVNETLSPMRQRRRRKFKQMAVDPEPVSETAPQDAKPKHRRARSRNPSKDGSIVGVLTQSNSSRKRPNAQDVAMYEIENNGSAMECQQEHEESSSLGSSDTDDGIFTFDEGQEGDDEQSDFFHESGPSYGIPGIIPWWEKEKQDPEDTDPVFEKILQGSFEYLPQSSQNSYKLRAAKYYNKHSKESGTSRKRYRGRATRSRISAKTNNTKYSMWPVPSNTGEVKRRRKTLSTSVSGSVPKGYVGGCDPPIPESNIGRQMLENMGWTPGDGLGPDNSGIKNPVLAYLRPRRHGLGHHNKQAKSS